jgi:hypothetical protein
MTDSKNSSGGADATRGLIVQSLAAMLDLLDPQNDIHEITLEPKTEHNQFDFFWKSSSGACAKQVKSSVNAFQKPAVKTLAREIKKRSPDASCSLVLIGPVSGSLHPGSVIEGVELELHTLNLTSLVEQAAHRLGKFLEHQKLPSGNSRHRDFLVHGLESKLLHLGAASSSITRNELAALMSQWISTTGSQQSIRLKVSPEAAQKRIQERIDCSNNILAELGRLHERVKFTTCFEEPRLLDKNEHDRLMGEARIWNEFNQELIRSVLFVSSLPYSQYMAPIQLEPTFCVFIAEIELTHSILSERIARLRSITENIVLFEPPQS